MFLNNYMTVAVFAFLLLFSCENPGHVNRDDREWILLTESSLLHSSPFKPIKFFDGDNGLAIHGGSIERTSDGGKNWKTILPYEEGKGLSAGMFTSESEGWVVGHKTTAPLILKTVDGGRSWSEIAFDETSVEQLRGKIDSLWDICFDLRGTAWMTGEGGLLQVQVNEKHLRLLSMFPTGEVSERIECSASGDVWALGKKSSVFRFRNGWVRKELDSSYSLTNIRSFGTDVWIIGNDGAGNGILLQSRDSGESWQNKAPKVAPALHDLVIGNGAGWLVGAEGHIYHTTNNGETWRESKSATNDDLLYIYSLGSNNVWISGRRETILKHKN